MGRLRVGVCTVDVASREVHVPGAKRTPRLAPKALAVLLALARQPGQVVTREQLLAEVWPDTLPTNDVVTQAITQVRKALASDGSERSAHIETIAKTGYRLLAPVTWETPETVDSAAANAAPLDPTQSQADANDNAQREDSASVHVAVGNIVDARTPQPTPSAQLPRARRRGVALVLAWALPCWWRWGWRQKPCGSMHPAPTQCRSARWWAVPSARTR